MYCSTHQMPLFPGTGASANAASTTTSSTRRCPRGWCEKFRAAFENVILSQLQKFSPELIVVSAGFDAHYRDPLASLNLKAEDFGWVTRKLMDVADTSAGGRIVSVLEGGYDLQGLQELSRGACHRIDGRVIPATIRTHSCLEVHAGETAHWGKQYGRKHSTGRDEAEFRARSQELETIVKRLEDGKVPLEESVAIYERGKSLKRRCEELLQQAEARVEKITIDASGRVTGTEPLDVQ